MNLTRSSRLGALALCLVLALAATGTAVAFDDSAQGLAEEYEVGSEATVTYTIADPFTNVSNQYTLRGQTQLTNVSWRVTVYRAGSQISQETYGGGNFTQALNVNNNGDEVRIRLTGTVPSVGNYTYPEEESFLVANLTRVSGNNPRTFRTDRAHHYTADSKDARNALAAAERAIEDAGGHEEAEASLRNAVSAYENENFQLARDLAAEAQTKVENAQQSAQTMQLILLGVGVVVVLGLVAGGFLYWRSQQDDYSKL